MSRNVKFREPKNTILIAVEGMTESIYMKSLVERGANVKITSVYNTRTKPYQIVEHCAKEIKNRGINLKEGDVAFAVFDVDDNTIEDFERSERLAKQHGIRLIISNPCFETWVLMHFRDYRIQNIDRMKIISELEKRMKYP